MPTHDRTQRAPADPVRICAACWAVHCADTVGFYSFEAEEWCCSAGCAQIRRLKDGRLDANATPDLFAEVVRMAARHTPAKLVELRRQRARRLVASRAIRPIYEGTTDGE